MKEKSISLNAVLNTIKTFLSVIFPLITYPYAARVLRVENMGKVDFSNSIVSYFVLIAGLGISTYAVREGARIRDDIDKLNLFASEMFSINLISSILSYVGLILIVFMVPKFHSYTFLIAIQSLSIFGNLIGVLWLFTIVEDYSYITIRSLMVHVLALVLMFIFVRNESDYVFYAATTVVSNVGANIFNFHHAKKYVDISVTLNINIKKHIAPIMIIFASTIATTIYVNSDKTILGFLSDEYHIGLYSTAVNVYTILKSCVAAMVLVALPRLSNYIAANREDDYNKTAMNIFQIFMVILLPVMAGIFVTSDAIIFIVGGGDYLAATTSLKILSVSLVFSLLAVFYSNAVLLPMKQETIVLKGTILSAVINVVMNFALIKEFAQNGAAFTTLVAELVMCCFQYFHVRKYLKITLSKRYVISVCLGCVSIFLASFVCDLVLYDFIVNLVGKIVSSCVFYFLILFAFKNEALQVVIIEMKKRISKLLGEIQEM